MATLATLATFFTQLLISATANLDGDVFVRSAEQSSGSFYTNVFELNLNYWKLRDASVQYLAFVRIDKNFKSSGSLHLAFYTKNNEVYCKIPREESPGHDLALYVGDLQEIDSVVIKDKLNFLLQM